MSWLKSLFNRQPPQQPAAQVVQAPSTEFAVDAIMRKLCDVDVCLPALAEAGMSEVDFWRVYNLTVLACSMRFLETVLSQSQLPRSYIVEMPNGSDDEIMFRMCEIYSKVRTMLSRYGHGEVIVASTSGQVRALNWCYSQFGNPLTAADKARIRMLPPRLPLVGQAESKAQIAPEDA